MLPSPTEPRVSGDGAGEHALRLESLDPLVDHSADFAFLDEALAGERVVSIGETDHFVAERKECRLVLLRELAKRGYRRIGREMGWSDEPSSEWMETVSAEARWFLTRVRAIGEELEPGGERLR